MKLPVRTVCRWRAHGLAGVAMSWGIAALAWAIAPVHSVVRGRLAAALPAAHPHLWSTRDQVAGLRQKIRSGTPQRMGAG